MAFIEFRNVCKTYGSGEVKVEALRDATFDIEKGEVCVIVGPSGAGKTTLLNILGGMDSLSDGRISLDGEEISGYDARRLTELRRYSVGFVFQFYNLVPNLTALENVELAAQICRHPLDPAETLAAVGLSNRAKNFPAQLSGGEQQRVSIARALGKSILKLLQDTGKKTGMTVVIITHNSALCAMADRVIRIKNGTVESVETNPAPTPVEEIEW